MRLKVSKVWSFLLALAFLVAWLPGMAKAVYQAEWDEPTTAGSGTPAKVCKDPSGKIVTAWISGGDAYLQRVDASGNKDFGDSGKLVLNQDNSLDSLALLCLSDGSYLLVAHETGDDVLLVQKVAADGTPQWGLDPDHTWGKVLLEGVASVELLQVSSSLVAVAWVNINAYVNFLDLSSGTFVLSSNVDLGAAGSVQLVKAYDDNLWVVKTNGNDITVYIVATNGDNDDIHAYSCSGTLGDVVALTDGNEGVAVVYECDSDDTDTYKALSLFVVRRDLVTVDDISSPIVGDDVVADPFLGAVFMEEGETDYVAVAYNDGANKLQKYSLSDLSPKWSPVDLEAAPDLLADLGGGTVGYAWGGMVQVIAEVEGTPTELLGTSGTEVISGASALALLPGSAYFVGQDGSNNIKVMKFSWQAKPNFAVTVTTWPTVNVSTAEDQTFSFTAGSVTNDGEIAGSTTLKVYLMKENPADLEEIRDSDCKVELKSQDITLGVGESYDLSDLGDITVTAGQADQILKCAENELYLVVVVNENESPAEVDFADNIDSNRVDNVTGPDIVPTGLIADVGTCDAGDTIHVDVTVENQGDAAAASVQVKFELVCGDNTFELASEIIDSLAANGEEGDAYTFDDKALEIPVNANGNCNVCVVVDSENVIGEKNDDNNEACVGLTVTGKPDLTVANLVASPNADLMPGDEVFVSFVVENVGFAEAETAVLAFYYSQDENFDASDKLLASIVTPNLGEGGQFVGAVWVTIPEGISDAGYILAVVDPENAISEAYEDNNVRAVLVTIASAECGPEHLDLCDNQADCEAAGGHWWRDACHAEAFQAPTYTISCVADDQGYAHVYVSVTNCGSLCGEEVTAAIMATDPTQTQWYSWTPATRWVMGQVTFDITLGTVSNYDLLQGYDLSASTVAGWYVGVGVDIDGNGLVDMSEIVADTCPQVEDPCAAYTDEFGCLLNGCAWDDGVCHTP